MAMKVALFVLIFGADQALLGSTTLQSKVRLRKTDESLITFT